MTRTLIAAVVVVVSLLARTGGCLGDDRNGGGKVKSLPQPKQTGDVSVEEALSKRRSVRSFSGKRLSDAELSQLLWAAQGITDKGRGYRAAPSAGATYPLETYAVTPDGIFRYLPREHAIEEVRKGDFRGELAVAALGQLFVRSAPLTVAFTAVPERTTRRYGQRGNMYIHMEAGHAAENIHLQAVALGLGSVPVGAFDDKAVAEVLGIPKEEKPLYLIPVGR